MKSSSWKAAIILAVMLLIAAGAHVAFHNMPLVTGRLTQ
jgi:hypothetical protein